MSAQYEPLPNIRRDARNKARNKRLQKERAQAMTTDAPPEKMISPWKIDDCCCGSRGQLIDYESRWFIECRAGHCLATSPMFKTEAEAVAWWNTAMDREAARRLSAPAPAAPRVGDDATGLEQWTDAEAIAGLRGDAADIHGRRLHMLANRMRDAAARIERLSAPPAASADEREDRVQVADEMRSYFYEDAAECSPHKYAEFLQCADIALGYRKLAPAQSVGQSAAQGVDDEIEQTLRDAVQAAILQLEYLNESQSRGTTESTLARLRHALSALPKGPSDADR